MKRSLQHPYTIRHTIVEARNPRILLTSSSSTGFTSPTKSRRKCFRCGEPYSRKHLEECRAKNVTCNGCGIKGHLQKCCKKSGNFPKDSSNRQNQSSSSGSTKMNYVHTAPLPQTEADFFDEKGLLKEYRPPVQQQYQQTGSMFILKKIQDPSNAILLSENGVEIQHNTSTSTSESVPVPVPSPDFPFQEFLLTEVVSQSQIDSSSISDMLDPRESSNSSRKATKSTDLPLKSSSDNRSHEKMRENRDPTVSEKHIQSSKDSSTISISDNSNRRKSISGIKTDSPAALPVETDISFISEAPEIVQNPQLSNNRSVMPTDIQALTVLQDLVSDDFQAKNTHSLQRKGDDGTNETFQLIQKIHNQLQQVQWDLQRLHSLHKYKN